MKKLGIGCLAIIGLGVLLVVIVGIINSLNKPPETAPVATVTPVVNVAPSAQISATPMTAKIGESITFSAAGSTDPDGNITSYEWDFGDGGTASGATVAHSYADKGGTYHVKLTVTDDDGLSDTAEVDVSVVLGIKIRVEVTSSTWRAKEPYDIYDDFKGKLEEVGFEVVPEESSAYDARLVVSYEEEKGGYFSSVDAYGTRINCSLRLFDDGNTLFEEMAHGGTPQFFTVYGEDYELSIYRVALSGLKSKLNIKYLGPLIATKFGIGDEISVLITALHDAAVRSEARSALCTIGEKAVEPLITALKDEDANVRSEAAGALRSIGDERAIEPLIATLNDEDAHVRFCAALYLGSIGDERAVEPLIAALNDEEASVRESAAKALGDIGDERAIEPLIAALNDEEARVRKSAARALGHIGDERAIEPLIAALNDEEASVRSRAAWALVYIGDERAIEPLTAALNDEDSEVRTAAAEALRRLQAE